MFHWKIEVFSSEAGKPSVSVGKSEQTKTVSAWAVKEEENQTEDRRCFCGDLAICTFQGPLGEGARSPGVAAGCSRGSTLAWGGCGIFRLRTRGGDFG